MLFMNEYDVGEAERRFASTETPNLANGARLLMALMDWADRNSDGWAYWPKPARAARLLMEHLQDASGVYFRGDGPEDITREDLRTATRPIKAFLTKQGIDWNSDLPWAAILPTA